MNQHKISQKEWDIIEKDCLSILQSYFDDFLGSIQKLRNRDLKNDEPFLRAQLSIALISVDTFSRFQRIFEGVRGADLDKHNEKRYKTWLSCYVLHEKNKIYKEHKEEMLINEDVFWKIRNSVLHFYSFPELDDGVKLSFVYNIPIGIHEKIRQDLEKTVPYKVKFVDLYYLIGSILEGQLLWFEELSQKIEKTPNEYIESVLYAYEIVKTGNMKTIELSKRIAS